jgi:hypothetical protein
LIAACKKESWPEILHAACKKSLSENSELQLQGNLGWKFFM